MAFIPVLACIQARLIWVEDNGNIAQNVFWHATPSVPTFANLEAIGGRWGELMTEAGLAPNITANWALQAVALRGMNEEEGISLNFNDGMPISGTSGHGSVPDQVAYTVTWSTGLVGRSARGRTYGIGVGDDEILDRKQLTVAKQAALNNTWGVILEAFETDGFALQVVSFSDGGVPRAEGRKLPILSQQVRFPLATQRRRLA